MDSGCKLQFRTSGGTIIGFTGYGTASGGIVSTPEPQGNDADMGLVVNAGAVVVDTTLPADAEQAYNTFISQKTDAMTSGGIAVYGGNIQEFSSGGYLSIVNNSLMSLNGVPGDKGNINLLPALGSWFEQNGSTTTFHSDTGCITCDTWTTLAVMEMILYHAINKIAWKIMREPTGDYAEGLWHQYQGLVDRWNTYAFTTSYVSYVNSVRETLSAVIGWCNPSCTPHGFMAYTRIVRDSNPQESATPDKWIKYVLFYMGNRVSSIDTEATDTNTPSTNGTVGFIINNGKIFFGKGGSDYTASLLVNKCSELGITSFPEDSQISSTLTGIGDINEFVEGNTGNWTVGILVPANNVEGMGYAAMCFGTGFASNIEQADTEGTDETGYEIDTTNVDTYTATPYWYDTLLKSWVSKPQQTLHTYALKATRRE